MAKKREIYPSGYFNQLDSIHVHIDGGLENQFIDDMVKTLRRESSPTKKTSIKDFIAGPQRGELRLRETYDSHTPVTNEEEKLEYFSTTLFGSRDETVQKLRN